MDQRSFGEWGLTKKSRRDKVWLGDGERREVGNANARNQKRDVSTIQ